MRMVNFQLPAMVLLTAALSAAPALAQNGRGNSGHGRGNAAARVEARRGDDRDDARERGEERREDRAERRDDARVYRRNTRNVPPGWCRGVGNPHNTRANCGYRNSRVYNNTGIYRDRSGVRRDRYGHAINQDGVYHDRNGSLRDRLGRIFGSGSRTTHTTSRTRVTNANCSTATRTGTLRERMAAIARCRGQTY